MTEVINIDAAPYGWMSDDRYAFIGRESWALRHEEAERGFDGRFGNPNVLRFERHRGLVIDLFRIYLLRMVATYPWYRQRLETLRGKTLVCFCKPLPCHGDVIVDWLEGRL